MPSYTLRIVSESARVSSRGRTSHTLRAASTPHSLRGDPGVISNLWLQPTVMGEGGGEGVASFNTGRITVISTRASDTARLCVCGSRPVKSQNALPPFPRRVPLNFRMSVRGVCASSLFFFFFLLFLVPPLARCNFDFLRGERARGISLVFQPHRFGRETPFETLQAKYVQLREYTRWLAIRSFRRMILVCVVIFIRLFSYLIVGELRAILQILGGKL